ncbi:MULTISPECIES: BGTF surface domain-containing protein [Halorussus]|uniref:BGTF surface domain-containing protein n=1 Tax=Halorussus TaxID=1070314 RepID=UPI0020A045BD|nr:BGTF surface domain-containing protein [Halorussus vallis]USZ77343.1 PGF-CTERM sorting domain-containing protein [Halorussus vallis]
MFDTSLHRRVTLAALVVLVTTAGAVAGVSAGATADAPTKTDVSLAAASDAAVQNATETLNVTIEHDADGLSVPASDSASVRGTTSAAPGTKLTVFLKSNASDFTDPAVVTVAENGTFDTAMRFGALDPGTEFEILVKRDGVVLARESGTVLDQSNIQVSFQTAVSSAGAPPVVRAAPDQTIRLRTDAVPGTELSVRVKSDHFIHTEPAVVGKDGSANVTFDFGDVAPNTAVELSAYHDGSGEAFETMAFIVNATANLSIEGEDATFRTAENRTVRGTTDAEPGTNLTVMVHGDDFERKRNVSVRENGSFAAEFDLSDVPPGANATVSVRRGSLVVSDSVNVTIAAKNETTTAAETEADAPIPGFGAPAALAALLAALALVASRRD